MKYINWHQHGILYITLSQITELGVTLPCLHYTYFGHFQSTILLWIIGRHTLQYMEIWVILMHNHCHVCKGIYNIVIGFYFHVILSPWNSYFSFFHSSIFQRSTRGNVWYGDSCWRLCIQHGYGRYQNPTLKRVRYTINIKFSLYI